MATFLDAWLCVAPRSCFRCRNLQLTLNNPAPCLCSQSDCVHEKLLTRRRPSPRKQSAESFASTGHKNGLGINSTEANTNFIGSTECSKHTQYASFENDNLNGQTSVTYHSNEILEISSSSSSSSDSSSSGSSYTSSSEEDSSDLIYCNSRLDSTNPDIDEPSLFKLAEDTNQILRNDICQENYFEESENQFYLDWLNFNTGESQRPLRQEKSSSVTCNLIYENESKADQSEIIRDVQNNNAEIS